MDRTGGRLALLFFFTGFPHPFPSRVYLIDPTGKLVGERSNRNQGVYDDEQK